MSRLIIEATGVVKTYRLGEHVSLRNLAQMANLRPGPKAGPERFRALDQVSFSVKEGSAFGIVGSNGSGKSTLLQILARVTVPDEGRIRVGGQVMPLLATGIGFHSELTGRENVVLLGTILGFPRSLVRRRMDDIIEFAGIQRHADTPLKRYSDGMLARLWFSIAMSFPMPISIFDEVLAVVDDEFAGRCIEMIRSISEDGRTVLFVSHDQRLVRSLCDEAMWLDRGQVRAAGPTAEVLTAYAEGHAGVDDFVGDSATTQVDAEAGVG